MQAGRGRTCTLQTQRERSGIQLKTFLLWGDSPITAPPCRPEYLLRGILSFTPQSVATDLKSHELIWLWTVKKPKKPRKMISGCVQAHVDLKAQNVVFITKSGIQINTEFSRHTSFEKTKIDGKCFLTFDPGARGQFESVLQFWKHLFVVVDRQCAGASFLLLYFSHSNSLITNVKVLAATANSRASMIDRKQHETQNRFSLNTIRTQLNMWYVLGGGAVVGAAQSVDISTAEVPLYHRFNSPSRWTS